MKLTDLPQTVLPIIASIQRSGITSLRGLAIALDNRGVRTARGGEWQVSNVRNVLARADVIRAEDVLMGGTTAHELSLLISRPARYYAPANRATA
jgi:hypothetical protein